MNKEKKIVLITLIALFGFFVAIFFIIKNFRQEAGLGQEQADPIITKVGENQFKTIVAGEQVEIGKAMSGGSESADTVPYVKMNRFDGEVSMGVGYSEENKDYSVVNEDDKVIWKTDTHEVRFYPINTKPPINYNTQSFREDLNTFYNGTVSIVKNFLSMGKNLSVSKVEAEGPKTLRFINLGPIDLYRMPAIYEGLKGTSQPTIVYYLPNEDGFGFYGYREAEKDLKEEDLELPIVRYRTEDQHSCPITYLDKDSLMFVHLYDSQISKNPEKYFSVFEEAIKEVLKKYDIEFSRNGHFLYYMDGLKVKQIGRMANDGNSMNYYMYLDSPLEDKFLKSTREYVSLRDEKILKLTGLREKNPNISAKVSEEIIELISKKLNYNLEQDALADNEQAKINQVQELQQLPKWLAKGYRNDVLENPEAGDIEKFEIELILNERPATNVFEFDIDTEGLNFYYQSELSTEEVDKGGYRPENIVGSYAVYYAEKEGVVKSVDEANRYKTGKAFHIYRPVITDSKGERVWGGA